MVPNLAVPSFVMILCLLLLSLVNLLFCFGCCCCCYCCKELHSNGTESGGNGCDEDVAVKVAASVVVVSLGECDGLDIFCFPCLLLFAFFSSHFFFFPSSLTFFQQKPKTETKAFQKQNSGQKNTEKKERRTEAFCLWLHLKNKRHTQLRYKMSLFAHNSINNRSEHKVNSLQSKRSIKIIMEVVNSIQRRTN